MDFAANQKLDKDATDALAKISQPPATKPMGVARTDIALEKLAADCSPKQFVRELTHNGIQACQKCLELGLIEEGTIIWDTDWEYFNKTGVKKLSASDNGTGITPENLDRYLNNLFSSSHAQSLHDNSGVGGKITTLMRNPLGVVYKSWSTEGGFMAQLQKDPVLPEYGLKLLDPENGKYIIPLEGPKPAPIKSAGTQVTLLGVDPKEETIEFRKGAVNDPQWLMRYLYERYFEAFPGVKILVRKNLRKKSANLEEFKGQRYYLDLHSRHHGLVQLKGAKAYWWILKEDIKESAPANLKGHLALLYRNELHNLKKGSDSAPLMQRFGIMVGTPYVVIYLEPDPHPDIYPNTARSHLLKGGYEADSNKWWMPWANEFKSKMPKELKDFVEAFQKEASSTQTLRDRLNKRLAAIHKGLRKYRLNQNGSVQIEGGEPTAKASSGGKGGGVAKPNVSNKTKQQKKGNEILGHLLAEQGQKASPVKKPSSDYPEPLWISQAEGSRDEEYLKDKAGLYLVDSHTVLCNWDFPAYQAIYQDALKAFGLADTDPESSTAEQVCKERFSQGLMETVHGVQLMQQLPGWTKKDIETAISEHALSAAAMKLYDEVAEIRQEIGSRLGIKAKKI